MGRKQKAESSGAGRAVGVPRVPSPRGQPAPAVALGGTALVTADSSGGVDSQSPLSNAPRGSSSADAGKGDAVGGQAIGAIGGKTRDRERGKYSKGGPVGNRGEHPKCGSPTDVERASASAIDPQSISITLPKVNTNVSRKDIPISPDEYIPFSENNSTSNADTPLIQIDIHPQAADIPPYFPEPGTITKQPALGRNVGRTHDGRVIPHERDPLIAHKIAEWVAIGAGDNEIAQFLNLRLGVIRKHYKYELQNGKFANDMEVGSTILEMAKSGRSERMAVLWAKAKMGWRESDNNDSNNAALLNIHIHT